MRVLALDIGDVWVGSALSDALGITCRPYHTIKRGQLISFLQNTIASEQIGSIVIGYPKTKQGTHSQQTEKTLQLKDALAKQFSAVTWILWDERMTSSWAVKHQRDIQKKKHSRDSKREEHSLAAAFILENYLSSLSH